LDHPHVIPIYQAGEEAGVLFLAMRYVEGTDLAKVIAEEGALEPKRAVDLLAQIAEALDAAHENGLIHRDVKPSNVLIAESAGKELCYLGDFGLTKRTGSLSGVSVTGNIVGTLEYVAPEQITGDPLDEHSDVYSLGCVLYECLTGQAPFPRATDVALLWAHVHEEPTPPSKARLELPKELDTVLTRALAKEPRRRYRSAGELIAATRSALRLDDAPPAPRTTSRRRLLVGGAAVAALLALAGALGFALLGGSSGLSSVSPDSVGVIDPSSNQLVAEVPVGRAPTAITTGFGGVWVANGGDTTVTRIDPADIASRPATISVPDHPSDLTVGGGSVLVALGEPGELVRIDPDQNEAASPMDALGDEGTRCGGPQASIAFGDGVAWFVCESGQVGRTNVRTGASMRVSLVSHPSVDAVPPALSDVALGLGGVHIVNRETSEVFTLDPSTGKSLLGQGGAVLGHLPEAIAIGGDSLWLASFEDDTVLRLTFPRGDVSQPGSSPPPRFQPIHVGDGPVHLAIGEGAVWVVNRLDASVTRIDQESGEVVATIDVGNDPQRVAAGEGSVWVTVRAPDQEPPASDTTGS
jgi:serine/threonine-protein kinase